MSGKLTIIRGAKNTKISHHTPVASARGGSIFRMYVPRDRVDDGGRKYQPGKNDAQTGPEMKKDDASTAKHRAREIADHEFSERSVGNRISFLPGHIKIQNHIPKDVNPQQGCKSLPSLGCSEARHDMPPTQILHTLQC